LTYRSVSSYTYPDEKGLVIIHEHRYSSLSSLKNMMTSRSYERKVSEVFGYLSGASSGEALRVRREHECPFLATRCPKLSQHRDYDPNVPFGACSVWHRGTGVAKPYPYIICPVRFVQNQSIFLDASRLFSPRKNSELLVIPELGLPIGRIDYVIAQCDSATRRVRDFIMLEVMACSTTTTGDVLRSFHDILQGRIAKRKLKYGINFRQVISRMMVQVLAKAYACEKWNKCMVWAVQDVLYRYMQATTKVELQTIPLEALGTRVSRKFIFFFVYGMDMNDEQEMFELRLTEVYGGSKEDFARIFEPMEIPESEELLELIQQKVQDKASVFSLYTPLSEGLARVAPKIVRESPTDYGYSR
jgi:hypothetical protein